MFASLGRAFLSVSMMAPVLAQADGPPPSGVPILRLGSRVMLQCVTQSSQPAQSSQPGAPAIADVDLRNEIPDFDNSGYRRTGGGCDQYFGTIPPGMIPGYVIRNAPINDAGWSCNISNQPGWPVERGGPLYRAQAYATACRVAIVPEPVGEPTLFKMPPDGTETFIARNGIGFAKKIQRDLLTCNTGNFPLEIFWNPQDQDAPKNPFLDARKPISPQTCLQITEPAAVFMENSLGQAGVTQGFYQWYQQGTFPVDGYTVPLASEGNSSAGAPTNGAKDKKKEVTPPCIALTNTEQQTNDAYYSSCKVTLPKLANWRFCFGKGFVHRTDGENTWAPSLIASIVDGRLKPKAPTDYNPKWNAALEETCRDMFNAREFFVMVGPALRHINTLWDPRKVTAVTLTYEEIP